MYSAVAARTISQYPHSTQYLHRSIIGPGIMGIVGNLGDRAERYVNLHADLATDRARDSHAEHRVIVDAIGTGDADRLHSLLDRFFEGGEPMRETIRRNLAELEQPKRRRAAGSQGGARGRRAAPPA